MKIEYLSPAHLKSMTTDEIKGLYELTDYNLHSEINRISDVDSYASKEAEARIEQLEAELEKLKAELEKRGVKV